MSPRSKTSPKLPRGVLMPRKRKSRLKSRRKRNEAKKKTYTYRSGLEDTVMGYLTELGVDFEYEGEKIPFIQPSKNRTYLVDAKILKKDGAYMYIEVKGKLDIDSRYKYELIRGQYPDMDLRFAFGQPQNKIYKGSPTTYAMWADKFNFPWCGKVIPQDWINEIL